MSSHQNLKFPSGFVMPSTATKADLLKRRYSAWQKRPKQEGQKKNVRIGGIRRLGPRKLMQTTPAQIQERPESQASQANLSIQSDHNKEEAE